MHILSSPPWIIQMFIGTLQTGLYIDFLRRGTLQVLQDFSPSRRSVLPIVFLVTMVPTALRSLTSSFRVVLVWFLPFLMTIITPWGEIMHGASDWGRLMVIVYFFNFQIIALTVVSFSPSFLRMVLKLIPALCRSTILSLMSFDSSFGLGHGSGEVGMEDTYFLWTGVLYTQRAEIRSIFLKWQDCVPQVHITNLWETKFLLVGRVSNIYFTY